MGLLFKQSLSDQIYEILRKDIITQKVCCGDKLNIRELQERLSSSSTPIREAINRLQQEGLVDYVTNVGAKVIMIEKKDVEEINELCKILDCGAVRLAMATGRIEEIARELKQHIDGQERFLEEKKEDEYAYHSDQIHEVFYTFANNERLARMSHQIQGQLSILVVKYQLMHYQQQGINEHKLIYESVLKNDTEQAVARMDKHYRNSLEILLNSW